MQWVREHSKPYKLELKYKPGYDVWREVQDTLWEAKDNERDLSWFLLRWS